MYNKANITMGISIKNNSLIVQKQHYCGYDCKVDVYCHSNSTSQSVGDYFYIQHTLTPFLAIISLQLDMLVFGYVTVIHIHPLSGVSSFCKIPDSDGNTLEVSIGIYSSMPSEFKHSYDHASDDNIELFSCTISVQSELH